MYLSQVALMYFTCTYHSHPTLHDLHSVPPPPPKKVVVHAFNVVLQAPAFSPKLPGTKGGLSMQLLCIVMCLDQMITGEGLVGCKWVGPPYLTVWRI